MSKEELTPWFPSEIKPVRKGWYETHADGIDDGISYWYGKKWSNQTTHGYRVVRKDCNGAIQDKKWRGLAKETK